MDQKKILIIAVLVLFVGAALFILLIQFKVIPEQLMLKPSNRGTSGAEVIPLNEQIKKKNAPYVEAGELYREGKLGQSIQKYKEALLKAETNDERAQIEFVISQVEEDTGNNNDAIATMKRVGNNTAYSGIARAYAIEYMGRLFYTKHDRAITEAIFADSPYSGLKNTNPEVSYRKLFEYASSFYPLAISEFRIAKWYADEIVNLEKEGLSEEEKNKIEIYKNVIIEHLKNGNDDLPRAENIDYSYYLSALNRKASLLASLDLSQSASLGSAEPAFKEVLEKTAEKSKGKEAFVRFNYAIYLARKFGGERTGDIKSLLSPLYQSNAYKHSDLFELLTNEKNTDTRTHKNIELLAGIDPEFKLFLASPGWKI